MSASTPSCLVYGLLEVLSQSLDIQQMRISNVVGGRIAPVGAAAERERGCQAAAYADTSRG